MRVIAVLIALCLLQPEVLKAQRVVEHHAAGLEGIHLDLASVFFYNSARLNIDVSFYRDDDFIGLRTMLSADNLRHVHNSRPENNMIGLLALFAIRTSKSQLDLCAGPAYFSSSRDYHPAWKFYGSADLRLPVYGEYVSLLLHGSTTTGGIGFALGYMRR
jgi:hypothetical protein